MTVALDNRVTAKGYLYLDDGKTFDYTKKAFSTVKYEYLKGKLTASVKEKGYNDSGKYYSKIIIAGIKEKPKNVKLVVKSTGESVEPIVTVYDDEVKVLMVTLKEGEISVMKEFDMTLEM